MTIDKREVLALLRARLKNELDTAARRAHEAAEAATSDEAKPEGDKDMRSTEASYVARGQAARAVAMDHELTVLAGVQPRDFAEGEPVATGALVELAREALCVTYFLLPAGGGQRLEMGETTVLTLTLSSPLGAAMRGLCEGDEVSLEGPAGKRQWELRRVW